MFFGNRLKQGDVNILKVWPFRVWFGPKDLTYSNVFTVSPVLSIFAPKHVTFIIFFSEVTKQVKSYIWCPTKLRIGERNTSFRKSSEIRCFVRDFMPVSVSPPPWVSVPKKGGPKRGEWIHAPFFGQFYYRIGEKAILGKNVDQRMSGGHIFIWARNHVACVLIAAAKDRSFDESACLKHFSP